MGHLTSSSSASLKTNPKCHKMATHTDARNSNQQHYQQLNPGTLQSSTAIAPTYEPLRKKVASAERTGLHMH